MQRVSQSPTDPDFVQNPYPFYSHVRSLGDFVHWQDYGLPMATTAAAVNAVLRHPKLGRQVPDDKRQPTPAHLQPFYDVEQHSLLELEPPNHTRIRRLVLGAFTGRNVWSRSGSIRTIAEDLIAKFPTGPFDLLDAYARPIPVLVISDMLGIPPAMSPDLLGWSNSMVSMYQARRDAKVEAQAAQAAAEFSAYIRDLIAERQASPGQDLISHLLTAEFGGQKLTRDELVSTVILLLNAGHEATVHSLGNAVRNLTAFPDRQAALTPNAAVATAEECLRFDPPLHMFRRWVYEDVEILGVPFQKGSEIGCLLGSACRDETIWPDGDTFDPFREDFTNTAFGAGIHFCVGAPLARLEMQIALSTLFQSCPDLRLTENPTVANLYHFRGLERLMVQV